MVLDAVVSTVKNTKVSDGKIVTFPAMPCISTVCSAPALVTTEPPFVICTALPPELV